MIPLNLSGDLVGKPDEKPGPDTINPAVAELFDNLPVAVYTCDRNGYITSYNRAAAKLWGREPEIGKDLWGGSWKIYRPDGSPYPSDTCAMALTLKEGISVEGDEIIIERQDGSRRNVLPYPVPVFNADGMLTGATNTLIDITEQKTGEEKQAMLAAIVESSDDAIISKTLGGVITSWNKAAEKLFGYAEQEILGKSITILIPMERQAEETLIIGKVSKNEKVDHFETIRVTKTGKEIPVSLTVSPIRDTKGRIIGASKIVRDISRQKDAEMQLQKYAENLEDLYEKIKVLNAKKDEFIGLASHELKTPITSISGYLQIIEQSFTNDDRSRGFIAKARSQVKKLSNLISDLLDVSKIQTGRLPLSYSSFDIVSLLNDVTGMMQQINPLHHISLYCDYSILTIEADQQRIEQVIINLISNAVKYSPNSDRVIVRVSTSGEKVKVSIQDFGIGIEPEQQDRIFSRFYRVEHLAAHMSGLGIGLFISKEIIKRHHGELLVESTLREGSTFFFEIPVIRNIVA